MAASNKNDPVIITCAPTGGIHTPTMSPHLPVTPDEIASESIAAAEAGAAVIHLHARQPETGRPDPNPDLFMEFLPQIKASCDAVINISTGGGLGMTREERLQAATRASPEMASLNVGSLNFGLFPLLGKYSEWKHDWEPEFLKMTKDFIFKNTFEDIEFILKELGQGHGTRFEFECYDLGHLYNLAYFVDQGWVKPPFFIQMVFGILGGVGADIENLVHMQKLPTACLVTNTNGRYWRQERTKCRLPLSRLCLAAIYAWGLKTACTSARANLQRAMRIRFARFVALLKNLVAGRPHRRKHAVDWHLRAAMRWRFNACLHVARLKQFAELKDYENAHQWRTRGRNR